MTATFPKNLMVPYAEKDEAKGLGARWNPEARVWFAPDKRVYDACRKWWPGSPAAKQVFKQRKQKGKYGGPSKMGDGSWPKTIGTDFEEYECKCGLPPWDCECYIEYKMGQVSHLGHL